MKPMGFSRRDFFFGAGGALLFAGQGRADVVAAAKTMALTDGSAITGLIPQGSEANLNAVVANWTRDTGIPITLKIVPVEQVKLELTLAAVSGETPPDFALPPTFTLQDLASAGIIQSHDRISNRLARPPVRDMGLYTLGDTIDGEQYGLQTDGDVYLMFYRQDFLDTHADRYADQFGTPLLQPTTWPELDRQLAFFHEPQNDRFGGALFRSPGYLVWEFWSRMHAKSHLPFDHDLTPRLHEDPAVEALEQMIAATAHLHPATETAGLFENWTLFQKNEVYCNIGWGGSQKAFHAKESPIRGKLAYGRLPGEVTDHSSYFNWGWSYVVPTGVRNAALGHLFASYATSPEHSKPAVREAAGYFDPFHDAHYDDPVIKQIYSPAFLKVHRQALTDCIPDLYLPGYGTLSAALSRSIQDALAGQATPKDALREASETWQIAMLDHDRASLIRKWSALTNSYPAQFRVGQ